MSPSFLPWRLGVLVVALALCRVAWGQQCPIIDGAEFISSNGTDRVCYRPTNGPPGVSGNLLINGAANLPATGDAAVQWFIGPTPDFDPSVQPLADGIRLIGQATTTDVGLDQCQDSRVFAFNGNPCSTPVPSSPYPAGSQQNEVIMLWSGSGFPMPELFIDLENRAGNILTEDIDVNGGTACQLRVPEQGLMANDECVLYGLPNQGGPLSTQFVGVNSIVVIFTSSEADMGYYDASIFCDFGVPVYVLQSNCSREITGPDGPTIASAIPNGGQLQNGGIDPFTVSFCSDVDEQPEYTPLDGGTATEAGWVVNGLTRDAACGTFPIDVTSAATELPPLLDVPANVEALTPILAEFTECTPDNPRRYLRAIVQNAPDVCGTVLSNSTPVDLYCPDVLEPLPVDVCFDANNPQVDLAPYVDPQYNEPNSWRASQYVQANGVLNTTAVRQAVESGVDPVEISYGFHPGQLSACIPITTVEVGFDIPEALTVTLPTQQVCGSVPLADFLPADAPAGTWSGTGVSAAGILNTDQVGDALTVAVTYAPAEDGCFLPTEFDVDIDPACNCASTPATLPSQTLTACEGQSIQVARLSDGQLGGGVTEVFTLHSGTAGVIGRRFASNTTGTFSLADNPELAADFTYFVTVEVGIPDPNCTDDCPLDVDDPCYRTSDGQPVIWTPAGAVEALDPITPCPTDLTFDLAESLPAGATGGTWSGPALTGSAVDLTALTPADGPFVYAYVPTQGCGGGYELTVTIEGKADLPQLGSTQLCDGAAPFDLGLLEDPAFPGGVWSGDGIAAAGAGYVLDPSALPAGTTEVTLTYTPTQECSGPQTTTVTFVTDAALEFPDPELCEADGVLDLTSRLSVAVPGEWSGEGVTAAGEYTPGRYDVPTELTFVPDAGCLAEDSYAFTVTDVAQLRTGRAEYVCDDDAGTYTAIVTVEAGANNGVLSADRGALADGVLTVEGLADGESIRVTVIDERGCSDDLAIDLSHACTTTGACASDPGAFDVPSPSLCSDEPFVGAAPPSGATVAAGDGFWYVIDTDGAYDGGSIADGEIAAIYASSPDQAPTFERGRLATGVQYQVYAVVANVGPDGLPLVNDCLDESNSIGVNWVNAAEIPLRPPADCPDPAAYTIEIGLPKTDGNVTLFPYTLLTTEYDVAFDEDSDPDFVWVLVRDVPRDEDAFISFEPSDGSCPVSTTLVSPCPGDCRVGLQPGTFAASEAFVCVGVASSAGFNADADAEQPGEYSLLRFYDNPAGTGTPLATVPAAFGDLPADLDFLADIGGEVYVLNEVGTLDDEGDFAEECSSRSEAVRLEIGVAPRVTLVNSPADGVCLVGEDSFPLELFVESDGPLTGTYVLNGTVGEVELIPGANTVRIPIPPGVSGDLEFAFASITGGSGLCGEASVEALEFSPEVSLFAPEVPVPFGGAYVACGEGGTVPEILAAPPNTDRTVEYAWSTGATGRALLGAGVGTYTLTASDGICTNTVAVEVAEGDSLAYTLELDAAACLGAGGSATLTLPDAPLNTTQYQIGSGELVALTDPSIEIAGEASAYVVQVVQASGCRQAIAVEFAETQPDTLFTQDTISAALGEEVQIAVDPALLAAEIAWTTTNPLSCTDCADPVATAVRSERIAVTGLSEAGCPVEGSIFFEVREEQDLFVGTAFSPNNDGQNDVLYPIGGPEFAEVLSFRIFDRYGSVAFERENFPVSDPGNGWDGQMRGQPASNGVYIVVTEVELIDGSTRIYRNDVTLMR